MSDTQSPTVASLPLPELIWRLSAHIPSMFHRSELGLRYASALGHSDLCAWPEQPRQRATVQASSTSAQALAATLLAHAAGLGWKVKLESIRVGWEVAVGVPSHREWLIAQGHEGPHEFPMLQAVAQALLMGHELLAGHLEMLHPGSAESRQQQLQRACTWCVGSCRGGSGCWLDEPDNIPGGWE